MKEQKVGYGLAGDRVTVLEQVGSNEGYFWNYVRFDNTPNAEGWIRTDYLSFQLSANQTQGMPTRRQTYQTSSQSQNYLGDRQSTDQGTSSYRQSAYSQQANSSNSLLNLPQIMLNLFKKS
ncbi:hypothetical protein OsccyDRAFT_4001 [Leptolyngbyaceae cyanobacterium JSC-12]|nr:hypothetical protein OsccyDRAFT_4001 [Leptolyngbyaceae cyanobacterium JSC-12]